ncbi:PqqD family peptide modification chaperone [Motilibacter aurantiacus]|uniref:PqqD family peptide modification chaperone n=1 Tax=Motilibacter aurantiacus TaxID=2714955 RepID=UPI00140987B3|nr:PqqD family peptide modification chaperone [Motilibacter aurantiacus]NHC45891.1 PqqD family peptide modification chaperone [Motilibacter aurantiacus]
MTRVVVAHDYVTQRGGAERVALAMLRCFPGAPLVTSVYAQERTFPGFRAHQLRTSPLQGVPAFRRDPRLALPLLAPAWQRTTVDDADAVVASSSGWAHAVGTAPGVRKVVYCHNPARWLYQSNEYFARAPWRSAALAAVRRPLSNWDLRAARSADRYLANSTVVAERIRRVYGIEAEVLPPPVAVEVDAERDPVPGIAPGFLLTVAPGVLVSELDGHALLLHPDASSALTLNESASAIWAACSDGASTVDELLTALHEELGVEPDTVRADVEAAVARLLDEGYLLRQA